MPTRGFKVYIDEAGDPGFTFKEDDTVHGRGGSSEWFVLSAVLQPLELDHVLADVCREGVSQLIKASSAGNGAKMYADGIHFCDMSHEHRLLWSRVVGARRIISCTVAINKKHIDRADRDWFLAETGTYKSRRVYLYALRILLRDVCLMARHLSPQVNPSLSVVLERRRDIDCASIKAEIIKMDERPSAHITLNPKNQDGERLLGVFKVALMPVPSWEMIPDGQIIAGNDQDYPGLQIADCVSSGVHQMLGGNNLRLREHSYASAVFNDTLFSLSVGSHDDVTAGVIAAMKLHNESVRSIAALFER